MSPDAWAAKLSAEFSVAIKECDQRGANFTAMLLRTEGPALLKAIRHQIPPGYKSPDITPSPFPVPSSTGEPPPS